MAEPAGGLSLERTTPANLASAAQPVIKAAFSTMAKIEKHPEWPILAKLPMRCEVSATMPHFRVRDLLALKPGATIESVCPTTEDVPFKIGGVLMFWSEFELVEERLAVRLTRLP